MDKTAKMILKIIGISMALAAVVCLLIGGWHDICVGLEGLKSRFTRQDSSEYDDYADEELFD